MIEPKTGWYKLIDKTGFFGRLAEINGIPSWKKPMRINGYDYYNVSNVTMVQASIDDLESEFVYLDEFNSLLIDVYDWQYFEYNRKTPIRQGWYKSIRVCGRLLEDCKHEELHEVFTKPNSSDGYDSEGNIIIESNEWEYFEYVSKENPNSLINRWEI